MTVIKPLLLSAAVLALGACSPRDASPPNAPGAASQSAAPSPSGATAEAPVPRAPDPLPPPKAESSGPTARDAKETDPLGQLDKREEQNAMPMAGQGNSHSSPALEQKKDPGGS